jgi:hypothetical protein
LELAALVISLFLCFDNDFYVRIAFTCIAAL